MNGPGPVRRHVAVEMRVQTRTEKEDETRRTLRRFSSRGCDRGGQPSAPPGAGVSVSSDRRHRSAPGSDPSTNHATKCRALRVVAGEPAAARRDDAGKLVLQGAAEPVTHRRKEPDRDEDPGLSVRVAVLRDAAGLL